MNFKYLYDELHNLKFSCDVIDNFDINRIMFGSGGSINVVLEIESKKPQSKLIVKVIPDLVYKNVVKKPNTNQLEIKFYQFFTKKYVLTDRSPHFVGIYSHQNCQPIDKFLKKINPEKGKCPSYQDYLLNPMENKMVENKLCDLLLRYEMKLLDPTYDVLYLEYCEYDLSDVVANYMNVIRKKILSDSRSVVADFIHFLYRMIFQLIFTLAIIKEDYPGFIHGDFFVRNILVNIEHGYTANDFVAYHYKQKIFYLRANGSYAKINDFGLSIMLDELKPNIYDDEENYLKFHHKNPFNQKNDIFNFLHDLYDGENIGAWSIRKWADNLNIPFSEIAHIRSFLGEFINVDTIDRINSINSSLLKQTWNIDGIDILENCVKTPDEYLTQNNYFEIFQEIPKDAKIIRHFNEPK